MAEVPDWKSLVSSRVGIVTKLVPQFRRADEPAPPYLYTATLSHFDLQYAPSTERLNAGKGPTEEIAKLSAVAEAVERYCAFQIKPQVLFNSSTESLTENKITPEELVLYSEQQYAQPGFAFSKFSDEQEITWTRGVELTHGVKMDGDLDSNGNDSVALPSSLVHLIGGAANINGYYTPSTSNGLAAGSCTASAVLGGLCELIERDAFLVTWMNKLSVPEIEIPESGICGAIKRHYQRQGVELKTFLMRSDQLPYVVMSIAFESEPGKPARVVGLGCELDPAVALEKSIFELCQARPSAVVRWQNNQPDERLKTLSDVVSLEDHADFYSLSENSEQFEFLWSSKENVSLSDLKTHATGNAEADLRTCVQQLANSGSRVAYVDLTLPDIASTGFRVVRSLATGLQPIHFGFGNERLGGARLFQLPVELGLLEKPKLPNELNPYPHPLA